MQPPVLHTGRLRLDAVRADDATAVSLYCADTELQRYVPVPAPYTRDHADEYCRDYAESAAAGDGALWAIRRHAGGPLLGVIEVKPEPAASAVIGFWLGAPHRGGGIMTEAAGAVCDWAFAHAGYGRIAWEAVVGNLASASVARSCGFRYDGLARAALPHRGERLDAWRGSLQASESRIPQPGWPVP